MTGDNNNNKNNFESEDGSFLRYRSAFVSACPGRRIDGIPYLGGRRKLQRTVNSHAAISVLKSCLFFFLPPIRCQRSKKKKEVFL